MKEQLIYGWHTVLSILQSSPHKISSLLIQEGFNPHKLSLIENLVHTNNLKLQIKTRQQMTSLLADCVHQGIAAYLKPSISYTEADLPKLLAEFNTPPLVLLLDGLQDPHNLGACLRTANAAGVNLVIIPKNNAVSVTATVSKVASGAAEITPIITVTNLVRTMQILKDAGIWLYGADVDAPTSLYDLKLTGPIGLVCGAEGKGLRRLTREHCDYLFKIPMMGTVSSLNVSVAVGVSLFEVSRQKYGKDKNKGVATIK